MNAHTNKSNYIQEHELVEIVIEFLLADGYRVRAEVSNLGQSADLVATRGRWITFVEVKVRDWRTALEQCNAHRLVGDYICIAIGTKSISETLINAASMLGIGIIHVNKFHGCSWVEKPRLNQTVWKPQRVQFSRKLRATKYVN